MPFANAGRARQHFGDHHVLIGVATLDEYLARAEHFCMGTLDSLPDVEECQRPQGDRVRYNDTTGEIGMVAADGTIHSYYIAEPARHGRVTNRGYFEDQCKRVFKPLP